MTRPPNPGGKGHEPIGMVPAHLDLQALSRHRRGFLEQGRSAAALRSAAGLAEAERRHPEGGPNSTAEAKGGRGRAAACSFRGEKRRAGASGGAPLRRTRDAMPALAARGTVRSEPFSRSFLRARGSRGVTAAAPEPALAPDAASAPRECREMWREFRTQSQTHAH